MKIDEAISILKQYIDYNNPDIPDFYTMEEAIKAIIATLEQEPCENVPDLYECPCGYGWDKNKVVRHHFCPNCGRAVDGSIKTEQEPCDDAISRDKAIVQLNHLLSDWDDDWNVAIRKCIETLKIVPPVTPHPKMGRWIKNAEEWQNIDPPYICSECGRASLRQENFCCSCGADMRGDADADID